MRAQWPSLLLLLYSASSCAPATPTAPKKSAVPAIPRTLPTTQVPAKNQDAEYRAPDAQGWGEAAGLRYLEIVNAAVDPSEPLPLLIVMHGLGDRPSREWLHVIDVQAKVRIVLPQAPLPYANGFAWFDYYRAQQTPERLAEDIRGASERVAQLIEVLQARCPTRGRAVVTGFSQGGMLSYALALARPELIRFAMPISGLLPEPLWPTHARPNLRLPAIHALHGDADQIVPLAADQRLTQHLQTHGYPIELDVYPGAGHAITAAMLPTIRVTLTRELLNPSD